MVWVNRRPRSLRSDLVHRPKTPFTAGTQQGQMPLGHPKPSVSAVPLPQGELDQSFGTTGQRHHSHWEVIALGGGLGQRDEPRSKEAAVEAK